MVGEIKKTENNELSDGFTRLELILDGNKLLATTSDKELFDESIQLELFGSIYLQANGHNCAGLNNLEIDFRNFEIINIDTISPI